MSDANKFRYDINGMRGWAVLAVVLYHFHIPGFTGGFFGVDVFFVISGYLMAGIVLDGLARNKFSLWNFYFARARRIWPALLTVVFFVLAAGWFLLMPMEYQKLGKHARDTLLFISNLSYLRESGYFDVTSHNKWLLHTWSLSVEWQFYLVYPLLMLVVRRITSNDRLLFAFTALLFVLSLVYSGFLNNQSYDRAFYLLPSRAWELLFGSLIFMARNFHVSAGHQRTALEATGFLLILVSFFGFGTSVQWSVLFALVPVLGVGMVLHAKADMGSVFTGNALLQFVGSRSYSVYLWHWPIVVLLVYFELNQNYLWIATGILASLFFGQVSYACIELPMQKQLMSIARWRASLVLIGILITISLIGEQVFGAKLPARATEQVQLMEKEAMPNYAEPGCADAWNCVYGGTDVRALILGDSHAVAMVAAVKKALPNPDQGIFMRSAGGCPIIFGATPSGKVEAEKCVALLHDLSAHIDTLYPGKPLIVISRSALYVEGDPDTTYAKGNPRPWVQFSEQLKTATPEFREQYRRAFVDTACKLANKHPLYLMRPLPEFPAPVPQIIGRAIMRGDEPVAKMPIKTYFDRQSYIWSIQDDAVKACGAHILDPLPYLCNETHCYGSYNGNALYFDSDHVGRYGVELLSPMFKEIFQ